MRTVLPAVLLLSSLAGAAIDLEVEGNRRIKARLLKEAVPPDPEKFSEDELAAWREDALFNLEDFYRKDGHFEARVGLELKRKEGGGPEDYAALIKVEEGPRYKYDSVRVLVVADPSGSETLQARASAGDSAASAALLSLDSADARIDSARAAATVARTAQTAQGAAAAAAARDTLRLVRPDALGVGIEPGDLDAEAEEWFKEDHLFRDRRQVLRKFGNAGYVRAQVEERVRLKPGTQTVAVDYLVEPSYPVVFDTLIILDRRPPPADTLAGITREDLLRSLVPYGRGDTVRASNNDRVIEKLQYTGAFNYVRLKDSLQDGQGGESALILFTEEQVPGQLKGSVFYETQYGAGVSVEGRHSNIAGTLNELRAGKQFAWRKQSVNGGYGSPLTFGYLVRFDADLDANWYQDKPIHDTVGFYDGDFRGVGSARLTWPWSYWLNTVANAEVEGKSRMIDDTSGRERHLNLNFIETAGLAFVNNAMDPTRGLRFALTWGNGGPLYKYDRLRFGEFRHNWLEARTAQYWYYPPLRRFKLATRLDGGRFFGNGEANSERFFLGGSRSVRSYDYQGLCTERSDKGICIGDNKTLAYALASAEVRMELFGLGFVNPRTWMRHLMPLQVVPFVDYGKVWEVQENPAPLPSARGYAYGLGFRYPLLGIFNLRLDFVRGTGSKTVWVDLAQAF